MLAKEAVVGTLNSLYKQEGAVAAEAGPEVEEAHSFWGGIQEGFASGPAALAGIPATLLDPLGTGFIGGAKDEVAEEVGADESIYAGLLAGFSQGASQAYAHLLFILLYPPCVAAFVAMAREIGIRFTLVSALYLLVVARAAAALFYQIVLGGQAVWIVVAVVLTILVVVMFWALG